MHRGIEFMRGSGRKAAVLFLAGAMLISAVGAAAAAVITTAGVDDGGFWVCINKTTKVVRYVSSGVCETNEARRWWLGRGLPGEDGADGAAGATGEAGPSGAPGADGADGVSGWERVQASSVTSTNWPKTQTVTCPEGKVIIGGGFSLSGGAAGDQVSVSSNYPTADNVWTVIIADNAAAGDLGTRR